MAFDPHAALPELVEALRAAYADCPSLHHLNHCPLPNRDEIVAIVEDLREVLFPGFGRRQNLGLTTLPFFIGDLLASIQQRLAEQIGRALQHDQPTGQCTSEEFKKLGQQNAWAFLETLPRLARVLQHDVRAAYDGDPAAKSTVECAFSYPGVEAITVFRLAHELHRFEVPLIPRMMTEYAHSKTGIDIHPGATIGKSFFIDHGTGVVIGETCAIGANVKLYQGVTLGALSFAKDAAGKVVRGQKRHPTLEDDVVVYANATILGGATAIGHHSVIGSSVWLTESVGPYTTVTMEKPQLRFRDGQKGVQRAEDYFAAEI